MSGCRYEDYCEGRGCRALRDGAGDCWEEFRARPEVQAEIEEFDKFLSEKVRRYRWEQGRVSPDA